MLPGANAAAKFGDLESRLAIADFADYTVKLLSTRGRAVLFTELCRALHRTASLPIADVRATVLLLMQQNLVRRVLLRQGAGYLVYATDVALRLRFPRFLSHARARFGDDGGAIVEELLLHGQVRRNSDGVAPHLPSQRRRHSVAMTMRHTSVKLLLSCLHRSDGCARVTTVARARRR